MNDKIVRFPRKVRPLQKTYSPTAPYEVCRQDQEDGSITFEVIDARPDSYRVVAWTNDDGGRSGYAKHDADQIVRALNFLVQCGKEIAPKVVDEPDVSDDE